MSVKLAGIGSDAPTGSITPAAGLVNNSAGYNPKTDIPADALDAKNFSSIDAWLDACVAQGKPGKIGSGDYVVSGTARYAPEGIYGYGDTPPKFIAQQKDCWLYLSDHDVTIKGVAFEDFGQVIGGAQKLQAGEPYHVTSLADFGRFNVNNGSALALGVAATTDAVGPAVTITDSKFVDCQNVYTFVSDTTAAGKVLFNNNEATGTWGLLNINSRLWTEVEATNNEWSNATQPHAKNNGYQTAFFIGTDYPNNDDVGHYTKLNISNNSAHDVSSINRYMNTNSGVFADVRGVNSENPGDNVISYNDIEHVKGVLGQEDSNAIYAKAWGLTIEGNHIVDAGADYVDAKNNGSETTGILVKPYWFGIAKDIQVNGNIFEDMPTAQQNGVVDLSVVKLSEAVGNSSVSYNTFIGGGNTSGGAASGVIRFYSKIEHMDVIGNQFDDVTVKNDSALINFNQVTRYGSAYGFEISNNQATLADGSSVAGSIVKLSGSGNTASQLIYGHNVIEGVGAMAISRNGTPTAPVRDNPFEGRTDHGGSSGPGAPGDTLNLQNAVSQIAENSVIGFGAKVADIQLITSAPSSALSYSLSGVDAAHFAVRKTLTGGQALYFIGASPDFEAQHSYAVAVTSHNSTLGAAGDEHRSFNLAISDVNEAPTTLNLSALSTGIVEHVSVGTGIKIADIGVVDDAMGSEAYWLSGADAASFAIRDSGSGGKALYFVGASPDHSVNASYSVGIDVQDASLPLSQSLHQNFTLPVLETSDGSTGGGGGGAALPGVVSGTVESDTLTGGAGDDIFDGGAGGDRLIGGLGVDTASYESASAGVRADLNAPAKNSGDAAGDSYVSIENLTGSAFDDALIGTNSSNVIVGGAGNDSVSGLGGSDTIFGGDGRDSLYGNGGNDKIDGGLGDDLLSGGSKGKDWFVFGVKEWGHDTIIDFEKHLDVLDFRGSGLSYSDLQISQQGGDVLITTGDHTSTILIQQLKLADLATGDFLFG